MIVEHEYICCDTDLVSSTKQLKFLWQDMLDTLLIMTNNENTFTIYESLL